MSDPGSSSTFDLAAGRFASGLAGELLEGRCCDLLSPLRFLRPGEALEPAPRPGERAAIASELAAANEAYGHPRARELAERFAAPETVVIVAGQQAGLLGGPLYSLTKMIGVARWAELLEARGIPAVGVFWVATEDHDYREVAVAKVPARGGLLSLDLGDDPEPLRPVGPRLLGAAITPALESLRSAYTSEPEAEAWRLVTDCYRPDATFGDAFCRLMVGLLGERAPLVLDSMLPAMKAAQRPWLERLVDRRDAVCDALAVASGRVEESGRKVQVREGDRHSGLFVVADGERRRVVWHGASEWGLRGADDAHEDVATLLARIQDDPGSVSPGVLARPALQDAVLGSCLQLMGPGELAYLAQAASLYPVLGIEAPATTLRPQMLVLERRQRRHLERLGLGLAEVLGPEDEVERRLALGHGGEALEEVRERVLAEIESLRGACTEVDANLKRPWQKTRDTVDRALGTLGGKLNAAVVQRDEVVRRRLAGVREACLPGGAPQERVVASAHYALRHGLRFAAAAYAQLDPGSDRIQIIDPEAGPA
ncbi:MAG: bacillithiol biosynthesis cysteine-adding enzyme BshC [Thermoanaerobaculia bacterium]|nr:bacillithiol biosynthesis cysteine-adding enzyme BshC [Thermoanaerobaculia bacterium]